MRNNYIFFIVMLLVSATVCYWEEDYVQGPPKFKKPQTFPTPLETMVDVTNDLAILVMQDRAYTKGNFAFSPYGVASVLVVLYEGARGETARQIHRALRLPWNKDITRIGFRDLHRQLVSYFTHEGYLSGMTLSKNQAALREDFKRILRFYGYDVDLVKHPNVGMTTSGDRELSPFPSTLPSTTEYGITNTLNGRTSTERSSLSTMMFPTTLQLNNLTSEGEVTERVSAPEYETSESSEEDMNSLEDTTTPAPMTMITEDELPTTTPAFSEAANSELEELDIKTKTTNSIPDDVTTLKPVSRITADMLPVIFRSTPDVEQTALSTKMIGDKLPGLLNTTTPVVEQTTTYTKTEVSDTVTTTILPTIEPTSEKVEGRTDLMGEKIETLLPKSTSEDKTSTSTSTTSEKPPTTTISSEPTVSSDITSRSQSTAENTTETVAPENIQLRIADKIDNLTDTLIPDANVTSPMTNETSTTAAPNATRRRRSIREGLMYPDMALELDNSMYNSHIDQGNELYRDLPRFPFLVDGNRKVDVPVMSYTTIFPFAYIDQLRAAVLEFPLDDIRYKLLLMLPSQAGGLPRLIHDLRSYSLRQIHAAMRPMRVNAVIPSFMVEGFVLLTSSLQQIGIWDVFDPHACDLSGMTDDPELYVRHVEQSITVVIRNYMEVLDIQTRTMAARMYTEKFIATHPFLYFVLDTETHVALMAGKILDPLSSRLY